MPKRLAFIGLTLAAGLVSMQGHAQTGQTNVNGTNSTFVTTAVPFLRISPDARAGGMGDLGIATSADPNAQYWNVAKLPFSDKNYGISATYTPWLKDLVPDIFLAYLAGYAKFGQDNNQAISASMRYFSLGNINYTDINANSIGTGQPREYSFDLGYSRRLSTYLSAGVTLRYIHSAIASGISANQGLDYKPGNTAAGDIGIFYSKTHELDEFRSNTFNFGAVLSNLGGKISYNANNSDFIPTNLGIGFAYTSQFDAYNALTITADFNKLLVPDLTTRDTTVGVISGLFSSFTDAPGGFNGEVKQVDMSVGLEYWYQKQFALRAGYFYENPVNGDRQYFTAGVGVRYNIFEINASYLVPSGTGITRNPLSNTVRFSLMFQFDKLEKSQDSSD